MSIPECKAQAFKGSVPFKVIPLLKGTDPFISVFCSLFTSRKQYSFTMVTSFELFMAVFSQFFSGLIPL